VAAHLVVQEAGVVVHPERLVVQVPEVQHVDVVLDVELPVGGDGHPEPEDLDELGGVEGADPLRVAPEPGLERLRRRVGVDEDEPVPQPDAEGHEAPAVRSTSANWLARCGTRTSAPSLPYSQPW
jgi:hypothetical protein